jgi:hypothetical protein
VTFDAASGTETITPGGTDVNHDFHNLVFNDAVGTATFELGGDLDVDGDLTVTDGIFDTKAGSSYAVTVGGNFSETVNSRVKANSSTFTITGDVTIDANNDDPESQDFNSASLVLAGAGSAVNYDNLFGEWAYGFNNLTAGQGGVTDTIYDTFAVRNLLTIGTGSLADSGGKDIYLTSSGDVLSFDAASNLDINTLYFNNSGAINLPTLTNGYDCNIGLVSNGMTLTQTGNVAINGSLYIDGFAFTDRAVTYDTGSFDLTVDGAIKIGNAGDTATKTFTATNSTVSVTGNFTINHSSNVFTSTGSTVILNGNTDQTITTQDKPFNHLTINNTGASGSDDIIFSGNMDVDGNLTLTDGDLDISTNDVTVGTAGNVDIVSGASIDVSSRTASWYFNGTTTYTDNNASAVDLKDVVITGAGNSLSLASNMKLETIDINADTTLNMGNIGNVLEVYGTGTTPAQGGGTFNGGTDSTVKYTGTGGTIVITATAYDNLEFAPTAATTYELNSDMTGAKAMSGSLTIGANATLDTTAANNYDIQLAGDWNNNGNFTAKARRLTTLPPSTT